MRDRVEQAIIPIEVLNASYLEKSALDGSRFLITQPLTVADIFT
jgi:hypothetical protein